MVKREAPRREFWLSHLAKWRTQGGTMKAYAQANDLPVGTFYAAKSAYARDPGKNKTACPVPSATARFLPVQLAPPQACAPTRISFPNGICIEVPGPLAPQQWQSLLDVLGPGA
jgi:hypothetical protein